MHGDREVLRVEDLGPETLEEIARAEPPAAAESFDGELEQRHFGVR